MKRNILLLTALVLAVVMLSGCTLWPFGKVKVSWEGAADYFVKADIVKNVKKDTETLVEANYKEDVDPLALDGWTIKYGTEEAEDLKVIELDEDKDGVGVSFTIKATKDKVVITMPIPEEDVEE